MAGDALNSGEASDPEARYRWYVLAILMLAYTVHYLDRSVVNAVLEPIRVEFHVSDAALGLLAGPVYAAAAVIDRTRAYFDLYRAHEAGDERAFDAWLARLSE